MIIEVKGQLYAVRRIKGHERYAASKAGDVFALNARWKTTWRKLHPYTRHIIDKRTGKILNRNTRFVKLDGKVHVLHQLIYETFIGEIPKGKVLFHKNGIMTDNSLENLELISRVRLGEKTGGKNGRSRTVAKIAADGEVLEVYKSAREAGRMNFLSGQSITDRCNGKYRVHEFANGYSFRWESEVNV